MGRKNKAHLLYLTGLSVDKNRMNNITENINFDKDYTYWLSTLQGEAQKIISEQNKKLKKLKKAGEKVGKKYLDFEIDFFDDESTLDMADDKLNDKRESFVDKYFINPLSSTVFKTIGYVDDSELNENMKYIYPLFKRYENQPKQYHNGDFFSLYLSNQSDSIGVQPLSKLSSKKLFNMEHAYCDWDYYDNKYIDHVILKIKKETLPSNYEEELKRVFNIHIYDILFSRIIKDTSYDFKDDESGKNRTFSFADLILKDNEKISKQDIVNTLSDRNFFGVNLLSQLLYTIEKMLQKSSLDINVDEIDASAEYHFLKELLEMSSDTKGEVLVNSIEPMVSAKIYFSNGIELSKNSEILYDDEYLKSMYKSSTGYKFSEIDLHEKSVSKVWKEFIEENIKPTVTYGSTLEELDGLLDYIVTDEKNGYVYVKVPIKIMLSLPLDENEKANSDIFLPSCLVDSKEKVVDVLTVGGAEHNRALSHLINKHRKEYREERLFGFMDNYYDFEHKLELDNPNNEDALSNSFNFFMGLNQPVSGWNYLLARREDDKDGNSINSDVKLITFKLKENKQKINVVSIYGFSAIASVLGINMFIEEVRHNTSDIKKGLFSDKFTTFFDKKKIKESRGTTATVFFYKTLKDIVANHEHKKSLYNDMQITLSGFTDENKALLYEKLPKRVQKLIVDTDSIDSKKYELVIKYSDVKDKLGNLKLSDIKLGQIKSVVRFFFNDKCYLNVFNNKPKKFSKILYNEDEENHLLVSGIQRGRVSTKS